jgi:hypothetical protein
MKFGTLSTKTLFKMNWTITVVSMGVKNTLLPVSGVGNFELY